MKVADQTIRSEVKLRSAFPVTEIVLGELLRKPFRPPASTKTETSNATAPMSVSVRADLLNVHREKLDSYCRISELRISNELSSPVLEVTDPAIQSIDHRTARVIAHDEGKV